jgi:GT2 family glycosyltransferase
MKLSVIIVNYNVEYFLEQCLNSVVTAMNNLEGEIFVVDNHSIDGSVDMVRRKFPTVKLIANLENTGFSRANNQALKMAKGEYCLLLNPDTLVEEDTFSKVVEFMDTHPDAGGLGVKMIDGRGNFLPESKRGLPTPAVAFWKIFGFSALFPRSKIFGRYHLGYLDKDQVHQVDVLSGAFMLLRRKALEKTGLLDEDFFMYGEDIDLSYRIIKAGFRNYYFPHTRIIHYKGESTKKSSVNYVFVFYNAMIIFARKHFSHTNARRYSLLISLAIYFRAGLALVNRAARKLVLPLLDVLVLSAGMFFIAQIYQDTWKIFIPEDLLRVALPLYALVWIIAHHYSGAYDKPVKPFRFFVGSTVGTAIILMVYALLSKEYQFSRLIILLGGLWSLVYYLLSRSILHLLVPSHRMGGRKTKKFLVVGLPDEAERVSTLLRQVNQGVDSIELVAVDQNREGAPYIGTLTQLNQIVDIYKVDEIIFCARDVSSENMINQMLLLEGRNLDFKIAQPEASFLIGSNSIETQGDLYVLDINRVNKPANRRNKRTMDVLLGTLLLLSYPITAWRFKSPGRFFTNLVKIIFGKISFVGYATGVNNSAGNLPHIRKGVLSPMALVPETVSDEAGIARMNLIYAKNHSIWMDFGIVFRNFTKLDR